MALPDECMQSDHHSASDEPEITPIVSLSVYISAQSHFGAMPSFGVVYLTALFSPLYPRIQC